MNQTMPEGMSLMSKCGSMEMVCGMIQVIIIIHLFVKSIISMSKLFVICDY
jgi:hypothetical protein